MPDPILDEIESVPLIETRNLCRIYGDGEEIRALDGINLKVAHGELVAVIGANPAHGGARVLFEFLSVRVVRSQNRYR